MAPPLSLPGPAPAVSLALLFSVSWWPSALVSTPAAATQQHGGLEERLVAPSAGKKPHILWLLLDDYGWAELSVHRSPPSPEVQTPNMEGLIHEGILFDRHYVYKYCSPTRSALQSGRNPIHVNPLNQDPQISNPDDPVSGFAGIPRNMTGIATKMVVAGYATAMAGKWDAGMASPDHTPHGRGYQSELTYFSHCNDYWTYGISGCLSPTPSLVTDLWNLPPGAGSEAEGPGSDMVPRCNFTDRGDWSMQKVMGESCTSAPNGDTWYGGYEDSLFEQRILDVIAKHNQSQPLFLFWAPHAVHTPYEAPPTFMERFNFIADTPVGDTYPTADRQRYAAMTNFIDTAVGNVTDALRARGMWDDLLILSTSDNGGPIYKGNGWGGANEFVGTGHMGGNNFPLKGGKLTNWEGGVRVNAWASGGFLPATVRGTVWKGLMTGWDWYGTCARLAGVDPHDVRAEAAGLPPVDSYDMTAVLMGTNLTSPRTEIALGTQPMTNIIYPQGTAVQGIIMQDPKTGTLWKLLMGDTFMAGWTGPQYPNRSTMTDTCFGNGAQFNFTDPKCIAECGRGCLYDLTHDEEERVDLALQQPERVEAMLARVDDYHRTAFLPKRCVQSEACPDAIQCKGGGCHDPAACEAATGKYKRCETVGGKEVCNSFWGPFVE